MILVTGATGFLGRNVVRELAAQGERVSALVHSLPRGDVVRPFAAELAYGDVLRPDSLRAACERASRVVHLVSAIRKRGSIEFQRVNHEGTVNVARAASDAGIERLVYVSAIGAADDPRLPFLHSKWLAEQEIRESGVTFTILRPSLLFGAGDEFFNTQAALVMAFPVLPVTGRGATRFQPIAVEDVARCVALAAREERYRGHTIEIGGPEQFTYDQLLDTVAYALGRRRAKVHLPVPLVRLVIRALEASVPRPPATASMLDMLQVDNVAEVDAVEREFGFRPRELREGLGYLERVRLLDAVRIAFGFMPTGIRDH